MDTSTIKVYWPRSKWMIKIFYELFKRIYIQRKYVLYLLYALWYIDFTVKLIVSYLCLLLIGDGSGIPLYTGINNTSN